MSSATGFFERLCCLFLCAGVLCASTLAQTPADKSSKLPTLLPREREMEMALSAGPEHLRKEATVYVLERGGFVKAREGTNGFTCLVLREGTEGTAPICYDAEGSQTTLLVNLRRARLREQGKSDEEIEREIEEGYRAGTWLAPRKPGIAYMLSTENHLHNPRTGKTFHYPPHVMLYAPYFKNSDIGAAPEHRGSLTQPWILHEGTPEAYIMVVTREKE
ncbi:MAG: hypothetical protein L0229_26270 [Blastocatellia bacterium]|nr:hypothetical protein [Blastocatellia bacterium]